MQPAIVPKFIEREARILGPFTFRQTVIIGFGAGIVAIVKFLYPQYLIWAIIVVAPIVILLGFVKIDDVNIIEYFFRVFLFSFQKKVYLWSSKNLFEEKERKFQKK
jgi:hypothetical protein